MPYPCLLDRPVATERRYVAEIGIIAPAVTYDVNTEKVQAECHDGVLKIFLPRPEAKKPKRIRISKS